VFTLHLAATRGLGQEATFCERRRDRRASPSLWRGGEASLVPPPNGVMAKPSVMARVSHNNRKGWALFAAHKYGTHNVHVHCGVQPPFAALSCALRLEWNVSVAGVSLNLTASPDKDLSLLPWYRSSVANGPFTRVMGSAPINQTAFTDPTVTANTHTYMVRAIKRERSGGGTYLNPSQGVFFGPDSATSWGGGGAGSTSTLPSAPSGLTASAESASHVTLRWTDTARDEEGFKVERKGVNGSYALIATLGPNVTHSGDDGLEPGTASCTGCSHSITTGPRLFKWKRLRRPRALLRYSPARLFVAGDTFSQGNWSAGYGADGFDILAAASNNPSYAKVSPRGGNGLDVGNGRTSRIRGGLRSTREWQ